MSACVCHSEHVEEFRSPLYRAPGADVASLEAVCSLNYVRLIGVARIKNWGGQKWTSKVNDQ